MTREKMLSQLRKLRFCAYWSGVDVGFNERPVKIDSKGYCCYSFDEPCNFIIIKSIPIENLNSAFCGIEEEMLYDDNFDLTAIYEHILEPLKIKTIEDIGISNSLEPIEMVRLLYDLKQFLKDKSLKSSLVFCGDSMGDWLFFDNEEALIDSFAREMTYYDGEWEDLSDEELLEWIEDIDDAEKTDPILPLSLGMYKDS